ncbi:MAG: sigma-70 family RNA polymerase sigma factor [Bacteroidota bacterium]|nr:sigma-70 family RNA polymerase sigma factor [Bacteroidota bacterium]MDP4248130.1 sigma-70 family RNA polymerase sigma factor [Bacteroidota bacterium]MDP4254744.1 sigma-70 family RNA polymerase sigma factor [Bacteroidota bacterium]MDP4260618.1 sigma-70 family RNA polymerase sigma factor [Bacteroidota bacterium]
MDQQQLIPHLFRTEYRKIVSVLCRRFGFDQIEVAEDIAGDTFLTAATAWGIKGIPNNPTAWLYNVAKNKASDHLYRRGLFDKKVGPELRRQSGQTDNTEIDLSPANISDSQLQMMFAVCHPSIPPEAQIGLSLRILCGFGIEEIADAFLTNKETINKRLFRAREKLREQKIAIELPGEADIAQRLDAVLTTIYLLFNEGYYSLSQNSTLRRDLCLEAMRLCLMLVENASTNRPRVNALLALMCFHASRFDARTNSEGEHILYEEQDTTLWDTALINKGAFYLHQAATGAPSKYHFQAGIAYWNTQKNDTPEKWEHILQLYNLLLQLEYSPMAALNRTYALAKVKGAAAAIPEAEKLDLIDHHFYFALLGELYSGIDRNTALRHFQTALAMARTPADHHALQRKIDQLNGIA